jgi:hypothetical protein
MRSLKTVRRLRSTTSCFESILHAAIRTDDADQERSPAEDFHIIGDIGREPELEGFLFDQDDRNRSFGRNPLDEPDRIAIDPDIADHEDPLLGHRAKQDLLEPAMIPLRRLDRFERDFFH